MFDYIMLDLCMTSDDLIDKFIFAQNIQNIQCSPFVA